VLPLLYTVRSTVREYIVVPCCIYFTWTHTHTGGALVIKHSLILDLLIYAWSTDSRFQVYIHPRRKCDYKSMASAVAGEGGRGQKVVRHKRRNDGDNNFVLLPDMLFSEERRIIIISSRETELVHNSLQPCAHTTSVDYRVSFYSLINLTSVKESSSTATGRCYTPKTIIYLYSKKKKT
jgi:hypothetical protein